MSETASLTCGHEFTEASVQHGSTRQGVYIPSPSVCETCKRRQCDDCAANDVVCSCCGGGICTGCQPGARQRSVAGMSAAFREYLCAPCAAEQDAARAKLKRTVFDAYEDLRLVPESGKAKWLADIHADLKAALAEAEKAL